MTSLPYIDKIRCAQGVVVCIWWYTDPPDLRQFWLSLYRNNLKGKLGLFSNRSFLGGNSFTFLLPSTPATQFFATKSYQQGTFSLYFNPAGSWLCSLYYVKKLGYAATRLSRVRPSRRVRTFAIAWLRPPIDQIPGLLVKQQNRQRLQGYLVRYTR